ncbi:MAG TPA: sugar porter family MFS transporter [Solirubrobacterales bacterium]|nr:sugar porter family MFS transporter [Solirubrobacterales bacterium]
MKGSEVSAAQARRNVVITAAIAGLAGLLFGYDTGIIAGALLTITPEFQLTGFESGMVVGAVPIGAVFGAWFASRGGDKYGRRSLILASSIIFIVGAVVSGIAQEWPLLVAARVVIGFGIGVASAIAPVYISEVAPSDMRGRLVTFFQLAVTVGILVAYLVGLAFSDVDGGWRWMLGLGAVPAAILFAGVLRLPQSPRWLMMKGRHDEAADALRHVRPDGEEAIESELEEIRISMASDLDTGGWRDLLQPAIKAALLVGIGLAILQQITGINTVIYYAPTIIQDTGIDSDSSAILASLGVGIINVIMTVVALRLLDKKGRRELLMIGVSGMALSLFLLGCAFLGDTGTVTTIIAIFSLMVFVSSFAISLGPIFWLLNAEIYPLSVRSHAASAGTMTNWFFNFAVSLTFLPLIDFAGQTGAFWFYAAVGLLTLWFCWKFVPETKGRSLEQIETIFKRRAGEK